MNVSNFSILFWQALYCRRGGMASIPDIILCLSAAVLSQWPLER